MLDDEFKPSANKASGAITVGEDLTAHSEQDLADRIAALEAEILRTRETLSQRANIRSAADALFKS
ncbi:DUF1192 family protein [Roseibium sp.]|uniref:DUF1192 family protein n=1 Tax=Roseibium sp. TaxID=1936156 RepID=UPI003A96AD72